MANPTGGFGFRFRYNMTTGNVAPVRHFPIGATTLYAGSLCRLVSGLLVVCDTTVGNNTTVVGVCAAYHPSTLGAKDEWPVILAHGTVFETRYALGAGTIAAVSTDATFMALTHAAASHFWEDTAPDYGIDDGSTSTGHSTTRLLDTAAAGGLKLVGRPDEPTNEWGTYGRIHVRVSEALMTDTVGYALA